MYLAGSMLLASSSGNAAELPLDAHSVVRKAATAQIPFVKNQGQIDSKRVDYYARLSSGTLFVTEDNTLVYSLYGNPRKNTSTKHPAAGWAFSESFIASKAFRPVGTHPSVTQVSQFKGDKPTDWRRHLTAYDRVVLGEPYPGIHVALRATGNNVEKLFYISPGAHVRDIKIAVKGVLATTIDKEQLVLKTDLGDIVFTAPAAYQVIDGKRSAVDVRYTVSGNRYGFKLGDYDPAHDVVIDPLLASTLIGGANPNPPGNYDDDIIYSIVNAGDSVYIAGATQSPNFPVHLGYDDTLDGNYSDGFITRMSTDLSTVLSSTFIGTPSSDAVMSLAMDTNGMIVAAGQAGYGFPVTPGAYTYSGTTPVGGGFIARFSPDLSTLVGSAVVTPSSYPRKMTLGNGGIYFGGTTNNPDFPITPNAYLSTCCAVGGFGIRDYDGFAGKLSADLSTLKALTYLGGSTYTVSGIAVAPDGSVFVTDGSDNAITGYIARFDGDLTARIAYLSYYPGSNSGSSRTYFNDVAVGNGFVVTAGQTYMNDLPATVNAFDTTCGTDGVCNGIGTLLVPIPDAFVAVYSYDLQNTLALTYLGGSDGESIRAVALADDGSVVVTGETTSTDFPTTDNANDAHCGTDGQCNPTGRFPTPTPDAFIIKLSGGLSQLEYGSYLGGSGKDRAYAVALDGAGNVYMAGNTDSTDFPTTPGAFDDSYNGGTSDAFISKIDTVGSGTGTNADPLADAGSDQTAAPRQIVVLDGRGSSDSDGHIVQYSWSQASGQPVKLKKADNAVAGFLAPFVQGGRSKTLVFSLTVTDDQGAAASDQVTVVVKR
jgi:hypothetical protein